LSKKRKNEREKRTKGKAIFFAIGHDKFEQLFIIWDRRHYMAAINRLPSSFFVQGISYIARDLCVM